MTAHSVERITGLEVSWFKPTASQPGVLTAFGYQDGQAVAVGRGRTEAEALRKLLENNLRRVQRIVAERQKWRCAGDGCGQPPFVPFQFHHIVLRSKGRRDDPGNIVGLCPPCHSQKHGG